jgi:hypothetical protein
MARQSAKSNWLSKNSLNHLLVAIFTTKRGLSTSILAQFWSVLAAFSLIF